MSRVQLALNVDNLDQAITFYSNLFRAEPTKRKPGYANFAIAEPPLKLVLIENPGRGGSLNHLGVEVESSEQVHDEIARLSQAGMFTEEQIATTCCFATQDKVWVTAPDAERWEVYTVLADSETFGTAPILASGAVADDAQAMAVCCGGAQEASAEGPCCGTKEEAAAEGACCGSAAKAAAVAADQPCCG
ncbi:ArsI/CadI family heavy metal resistance metalloenzyme [Nocardia sp. NBC_00511]|uniref:ArsI/CadI family heavy metal resistance metalloenzyme n=1 Tax=Nocardia sp. NBC_00511 TaxID=2903591 RepID=UPI0030E2F5E6